jgi:hypothetical protein
MSIFGMSQEVKHFYVVHMFLQSEIIISSVQFFPGRRVTAKISEVSCAKLGVIQPCRDYIIFIIIFYIFIFIFIFIFNTVQQGKTGT